MTLTYLMISSTASNRPYQQHSGLFASIHFHSTQGMCWPADEESEPAWLLQLQVSPCQFHSSPCKTQHIHIIIVYWHTNSNTSPALTWARRWLARSSPFETHLDQSYNRAWTSSQTEEGTRIIFWQFHNINTVLLASDLRESNSSLACWIRAFPVSNWSWPTAFRFTIIYKPLKVKNNNLLSLLWNIALWNTLVHWLFLWQREGTLIEGLHSTTGRRYMYTMSSSEDR